MGEKMTITGGCFCEAIRYESTETPSARGMCHCRMCQRWTGSGAAMGMKFNLKSFRFTKGKPKLFKTSDVLERAFCPDCGTSLMHRYLAPPVGPDDLWVYLGTLDDPYAFEGPEGHMGIESHIPHWINLDESVPIVSAKDNPRLAETRENYKNMK
jgi:adenylate cyclase